MQRLLLAFALAACVRTAPSSPPRVSPLPATRDIVTFLHINDVYEITPVEGGRSGGLARVAALKQRLARERGPVVLTLGGDFLSPSALGTARVDGAPLAGRQMVGVLNAAGLDWATLGNHEFDISEALFRQRVAESRFQWVIGNVTDTLGQPFPAMQRRAMLRFPMPSGRTVRIGLVGTVTPVNRVPWVKYQDQYATVRADVDALRDSVDAVVALTHQYYYEDDRLATEVGGIDLILGGHEHENFVLRRGAQLAPIVKADGNARTAQVVTVHFGPAGTRPTVTTELVPVTDAMPSDPAVEREVERWLTEAFAGYSRLGFAPRDVVVELPVALDARETTIRVQASNLTDLLLAAMRREAPDAEVALFNVGSIRLDDIVPAGRLTQYDVIRILPFGGLLVRVDVTGDILRRVLEAGRRNIRLGGFLHASGAELQGSEWRIGGAPIDPARSYRVVTTDFLLTGRETNLSFFVAGTPGIEGRRDLRDVRFPLIEELRARYGGR